jgi:serine/threonine-protein kinase
MSSIIDPFGLLGATLDSKYEVSAVVAEGGFAVVYRALHVGLHKPVALKVLKIPSELSDEHCRTYLEKFAQEARLIAALDHPAIVRVLDFGVAPLSNRVDTPWMALEWLDGTTLEQVLESCRGQPLEPAVVFTLMEPVIDALACAHERGVVHRDLKPANLMRVTGRRGEAVLKVLDFGIAKTLDAGERAPRPGAGRRSATTSRPASRRAPRPPPPP